MPITKNMSGIDRLLRLIIGVGLTYIGFFYDNITNYTVINGLIGIFGLINIISAIFASCPIYNIVGISTCNNKSND